MTRTTLRTSPRPATRRGRTLLVRTSVAAAAVASLAACTSATAGSSDGPDGSETSDGTAAPAAPTESDVRGWFDDWNAALATGDAETVAERYTDDGVLLSTLSSDIREGRDEIAGYFEEDFLPKQPQGVITESIVRVLDEDTVVHDGLYDFTVTGEGGEESVVPARFTYVYELVDGEWLIRTHHSSAQPD